MISNVDSDLALRVSLDDKGGYVVVLCNTDETTSRNNFSVNNHTGQGIDNHQQGRPILSKVPQQLTRSVQTVSPTPQETLNKVNHQLSHSVDTASPTTHQTVNKDNQQLTHSVDTSSPNPQQAFGKHSQQLTHSVDTASPTTQQTVSKYYQQLTHSVFSLSSNPQQAFGKHNQQLIHSVVTALSTPQKTVSKDNQQLTNSVYTSSPNPQQAFGKHNQQLAYSLDTAPTVHHQVLGKAIQQLSQSVDTASANPQQKVNKDNQQLTHSVDTSSTNSQQALGKDNQQLAPREKDTMWPSKLTNGTGPAEHNNSQNAAPLNFAKIDRFSTGQDIILPLHIQERNLSSDQDGLINLSLNRTSPTDIESSMSWTESTTPINLATRDMSKNPDANKTRNPVIRNPWQTRDSRTLEDLSRNNKEKPVPEVIDVEDDDDDDVEGDLVIDWSRESTSTASSESKPVEDVSQDEDAQCSVVYDTRDNPKHKEPPQEIRVEDGDEDQPPAAKVPKMVDKNFLKLINFIKEANRIAAAEKKESEKLDIAPVDLTPSKSVTPENSTTLENTETVNTAPSQPAEVAVGPVEVFSTRWFETFRRMDDREKVQQKSEKDTEPEAVVPNSHSKVAEVPTEVDNPSTKNGDPRPPAVQAQNDNSNQRIQASAGSAFISSHPIQASTDDIIHGNQPIQAPTGDATNGNFQIQAPPSSRFNGPPPSFTYRPSRRGRRPQTKATPNVSNSEKSENKTFGNYIVTKLNTYSLQRRKGVEHAFYEILMQADRGYFDRFPQRPLPGLFSNAVRQPDTQFPGQPQGQFIPRDPQAQTRPPTALMTQPPNPPIPRQDSTFAYPPQPAFLPNQYDPRFAAHPASQQLRNIQYNSTSAFSMPPQRQQPPRPLYDPRFAVAPSSQQMPIQQYDPFLAAPSSGQVLASHPYDPRLVPVSSPHLPSRQLISPVRPESPSSQQLPKQTIEVNKILITNQQDPSKSASLTSQQIAMQQLQSLQLILPRPPSKPTTPSPEESGNLPVIVSVESTAAKDNNA